MNQPGKFDKLIDIETPTDSVSDGAGGTVNEEEGADWETVYQNIWANVVKLSGRRLLEFGAIEFLSAYQVRVYKGNVPDMDEHCKIIYNNKRLTIHSITDENEERNELVILAYHAKGENQGR